MTFDFCLTTMITVYPSPTNITKCPMSTMILQDYWLPIVSHLLTITYNYFTYAKTITIND